MSHSGDFFSWLPMSLLAYSKEIWELELILYWQQKGIL